MDSDSTMWVIIGVVLLLLFFFVVIVGVGAYLSLRALTQI